MGRKTRNKVNSEYESENEESDSSDLELINEIRDENEYLDKVYTLYNRLREYCYDNSLTLCDKLTPEKVLSFVQKNVT